MITQRFGIDILRMKGILSLKDDDDRFVVQAVHMLLEGDHQRPWKKDEPRVSRLVFIGRNMPKDVVEDGFINCRAESVEQQTDDATLAVHGRTDNRDAEGAGGRGEDGGRLPQARHLGGDVLRIQSEAWRDGWTYPPPAG
jgi:hypothetical protein